MDFLGNKENKNITFIGLNLPFLSLLTKDQTTIALLEDVTGIKSGEKPIRQIVKMNVKQEGNVLSISAEKADVITNIAYLDSFNVTEGAISEFNNLVRLDGNKAEIIITYPYLKSGLLISVLGIMMLGSFLIMSGRKIQRNTKKSYRLI